MRWVYLDNLKVLLIAGVIVAHGLLGYSDLEVWPYGLVRESTLAAPTHAVALAVAGPFALFLMALLFLVAGLLTPESLHRKGTQRFVRDRLLRLGVPFLVFVGLLWPVLLYALYRPLGHVTGSFWVATLQGEPDTGPAWFVAVLLLFSLLYAAWSAVRPARLPTRPGHPVTATTLGVLAAGVAVASFAIRLWLPFASEAPLDLNEWQWPECAVLFGIGVVTARRGWLTQVPPGLAVRARQVTLAAAVAAAAYTGVAGPLGIELTSLVGGFRPEALVFATLEGLLTVFGSVWLLAVAQRRLDRPLPRGRELARCSYAAFLVQGAPLLGLAAALRPVPVPAEAKAVVVALGGVALSYGLGCLLVRLPGARRVLGDGRKREAG
jgi:hypothetical protein